jgi:hypothetical protein
LSETSATAPFSATMASTGQARALGSDHPTGRPVIAITVSPAARSAASASSASAVMSPCVVSVSSMSVKTPRMARRSASGQSDRGRKEFMA